MDSLAHFILALIAGMAMGLHRKHKVTYIAFISFLAVLIDLDHFLVPLGYTTVYRSMHNVYVTMIAPFALFIASYHFEKNTRSDRWQTFFLLLGVMLTGHVIADMIYGPVKIFYPLDDRDVYLPNIDIQATSDFTSEVIGPIGIGMTAYAVIIFFGSVVHDTLYHMRHNGLQVREAFRRSLSDLF